MSRRLRSKAKVSPQLRVGGTKPCLRLSCWEIELRELLSTYAIFFRMAFFCNKSVSHEFDRRRIELNTCVSNAYISIWILISDKHGKYFNNVANKAMPIFFKFKLICFKMKILHQR